MSTIFGSFHDQTYYRYYHIFVMAWLDGQWANMINLSEGALVMGLGLHFEQGHLPNWHLNLRSWTKIVVNIQTFLKDQTHRLNNWTSYNGWDAFLAKFKSNSSMHSDRRKKRHFEPRNCANFVAFSLGSLLRYGVSCPPAHLPTPRLRFQGWTSCSPPLGQSPLPRGWRGRPIRRGEVNLTKL